MKKFFFEVFVISRFSGDFKTIEKKYIQGLSWIFCCWNFCVSMRSFRTKKGGFLCEEAGWKRVIEISNRNSDKNGMQNQKPILVPHIEMAEKWKFWNKYSMQLWCIKSKWRWAKLLSNYVSVEYIHIYKNPTRVINCSCAFFLCRKCCSIDKIISLHHALPKKKYEMQSLKAHLYKRQMRTKEKKSWNKFVNQNTRI